MNPNNPDPTAHAAQDMTGKTDVSDGKAASGDKLASGDRYRPGNKNGSGDKIVPRVIPGRPDWIGRLELNWMRVRLVLRLSWDGFWDDRCTMAASSLAYQTALALVPLIAVALALLKASGQLDAGSNLLSFVMEQIFPSSPEARAEILKNLSHFSDKIAAGALGSFGLVTSIAVGFFLFLSVESIWNRIWESHRERTYIERFLLFYTGITLLPFVAAVSFLHTASLWGRYAVSRLLLSLFSTAVTLSLANRLVPTLRVSWRAALIGGATSALLLELTKFGLGLYLSMVTGSYSSLYGALGVLPLFLLSIYVWWIIILWGVEVCRALQRLPLLARALASGNATLKTDDPNLPITGALAARLLCDVARNFKSGHRSLAVVELEERHGLPEGVVRRVLARLEAHHLVVKHDDGYLLARPPDTIRLDEVLRIFQPAAHFYAQNEPDALDQVLSTLDQQTQEQTQSVTFASLI